jgi:hypothetical protein
MSIGYEESGYEIPKSRGIPPVVRYLFGAGLVVIFFMGFISVRFSGTFHVWPVTQTTQVELPGKF